MKTSNNLVRKVKEWPRNIALWTAGVGLGAIVASSCAPLTVAQQEAILGSGLTIAGSYGLAGKKTKTDKILNEAMIISGGVVTQQAQMRHQLEVANAGKTDITINNNPPVQQQNQGQINTSERDQRFYEMWDNASYKKREEIIEVLDNIDRKTALPQKLQELDRWYKYMENNSEIERFGTPVGFFMHTGWQDKAPFENEAHTDEYKNLNSSVFDIRNSNRLCFSFYSERNPDYDGKIELQVWKMEGNQRKELIVNESEYYDCQKISESCFTKYKFEENGDYQAILKTPKGGLLKDFYLIIK